MMPGSSAGATLAGHGRQTPGPQVPADHPCSCKAEEKNITGYFWLDDELVFRQKPQPEIAFSNKSWVFLGMPSFNTRGGTLWPNACIYSVQFLSQKLTAGSP